MKTILRTHLQIPCSLRAFTPDTECQSVRPTVLPQRPRPSDGSAARDATAAASPAFPSPSLRPIGVWASRERKSN